MTVVLVPRRGGGEFRERNWETVRGEIEGLGYQLVVADSEDEPFSVARSYNLAAARAGHWDKAILWEADGWCPPDQVHAAVDAATDGLVYCYDRWVKLNEEGTRAFWDGKRSEFGRRLLRRRQQPYPLTILGAGPRVVTSDLWEATGGFDERFLGWGPEDQDFAHRCEAVAPHSRIDGNGYDLWHPTAPRDRLEANRAVLRENLKNPR